MKMVNVGDWLLCKKDLWAGYSKDFTVNKYYKVDEIPSVNIIYLIDDNDERHGVGYDWFKCFSLAKPFERKLKFT